MMCVECGQVFLCMLVQYLVYMCDVDVVLVQVFVIVCMWCEVFEDVVILFEYVLVQIFEVVVVYEVLYVVLLVVDFVGMLEIDLVVVVVDWCCEVDDFEVVVGVEFLFVWNCEMYLQVVCFVEFDLVEVYVVLVDFFEYQFCFGFVYVYVGLFVVFGY